MTANPLSRLGGTCRLDTDGATLLLHCWRSDSWTVEQSRLATCTTNCCPGWMLYVDRKFCIHKPCSVFCQLTMQLRWAPRPPSAVDADWKKLNDASKEDCESAYRMGTLSRISRQRNTLSWGGHLVTLGRRSFVGPRLFYYTCTTTKTSSLTSPLTLTFIAIAGVGEDGRLSPAPRSYTFHA